MSGFGETLTGGIQDLSALLPLIGTEQCERHVGSALEGGYLYAAAAPLSLFGSPGIVKTGLSVLIASISIPSVKLYRSPRLSLAFSGRRWCGARVLDDAGFKPVGTVAPMIAMDKKRYTAESRLLQMLNEKHIDNFENVTIEWTSVGWNVRLILCTLIAAALSYTPYFHLVLGTQRLAWVFPLVRTLGSCLTAVCCQFLIQSRIVSIMKNRIIFMTMHRRLLHDLKAKGIDMPESRLQSQNRSQVRWNSDFIAEECLWSLEIYLTKLLQHPQLPPAPADTSEKNIQASLPPSPTQSYISIVVEPPDDPSSASSSAAPSPAQSYVFEVEPPEDSSSASSSAAPSPTQSHIIEVEPPEGSSSTPSSAAPSYVSVPVQPPDDPVSSPPTPSPVPTPFPDNPFRDLDHRDILNQLRNQRKSHFPNPVKDWVFISSSWVLLLVSLPAAIAGYIGSFTLASNSAANGPAIWLGIELALSVVRILLWAWNPGFDEKSDFTVHLKLTEHEPLVTTEKDVELLSGILPLIPEQRFLEFITRYTGPLEQFKGDQNIVLYFTLSGIDGQKRLFMTALDANKRMAFVVHQDQGRIVYTNCSVDPDTDKVEMQATLLSEVGDKHPWKINYPDLLSALSDHYNSLLRALNRYDPDTHARPDRRIQGIPTMFMSWFGPLTAPHRHPTIRSSAMTSSFNISSSSSTPLLMKWSFESKVVEREEAYHIAPMLRPLLEHDRQYLQRGYEHHLKTRLMKTWSDWFVEGIEVMRNDALLDCHLVNEEPVKNERAKQLELNQLDAWVAKEWQKYEVTLLKMSIKSEEVLDSRMEEYFKSVVKLQGREWMGDWFSLEWSAGRKKRLENERTQAEERMVAAAKRVVEGNTEEARTWWQRSQRLVDEAWEAAILGENIPSPDDQLPRLLTVFPDFELLSDIQKRLMVRNDPLEAIWTEMEKRVDQIRDADLKHLDQAYLERYLSTPWTVFSRFADFRHLSRGHGLLAARLSIGTVYDVALCSSDVIHQVARKSSARSVINLTKGLTIEPNDHLLYVSDTSHKEVPLSFTQQNRERWWTDETASSWTYYLSPTHVNGGLGAGADGHCTIAHLMISLQTSTRLRIKLLHYRDGLTTLSIQKRKKEIHRIHSNDIPLDPRLCSFELGSIFETGKHELDLVVTEGAYILQNILVEFLDDTPLPSLKPFRRDNSLYPSLQPGGAII